MSDQFVGEIRMFTGNFEPTGWAFCNGQVLSIAQNTALFSLLGTNYGGDGKSTFALPDLRARFPLHAGSSAGPGLTPRTVGESGGTASIALTAQQIPAHSHQLMATAAASGGSPAGAALAPSANGASIYRPLTHPVQMPLASVGLAGGNFPHNNLQPFLALNFIIALQGIFPPRA